MIKESRLNFIFILVVAFASYMAFNKSTMDGGTPYSCNTEDITSMYEGYIEEWKQEINIAFDKAEKQIIDIDTPDVIGPDPDPDKCICGGSGWITQGDGHKTRCPYHGEGSSLIKENELNIIHKH
tara:strand:+ start:1648 stop:2022 length:375 start_codon:yes stop_codon:yes gene_type:complete